MDGDDDAIVGDDVGEEMVAVAAADCMREKEREGNTRVNEMRHDANRNVAILGFTQYIYIYLYTSSQSLDLTQAN